MKPLEIIRDIFNGTESGLKGVLNPVSSTTVDQMKIMNSYFPEAHFDKDKMFELSRANHEILGYDGIMPVFSVVIEAASIGARINWGSPLKMPQVIGKLWKDYSDIKIDKDFISAPPSKAVLGCITKLKDRYPDVAVIGKVFGPWTLGYDFFGVEDFLIKTIEKPGEVKDILKKLSGITLLFAEAQIKAGADFITVADHCTRDLCSPISYRDFLIPVHSLLSENIKRPIMLHICGDTSDRIQYIIETGVASFHFESKVDACLAVKLARGKIKLIGNINNPGTLLFKKPEDVERDVRYAIDCGVDIIGPECAVPLTTPLENLKQIARSVKKHNANL